MVLAASYSTKMESIDCLPAVLYGELDHAFLQLQKHAYSGIEISLASPEEINLVQLDQLLKKTQVKLSAFSTEPILSCGHGDLDTDNDDVRRTTISRIKEIIHLASRYKVPVIIGHASGKVRLSEGLGIKRNESYLKESLADLLSEANENQVVLLYEVVGHVGTELGNTIRDTAAIVRSFRSPNLKLALDTCQLGDEILPVYDSLITSADVLAYIHLSDSEHMPPGKGKIEFFKIFRALDRIHYNGWLCVKSFPDPNVGTALDAASFSVIKNTVALRCP